MEVYESLLLDGADLQYQLDSIVSFLLEVHPKLGSEEKNTYPVELRPILREGKNFKYSRSLLLWSLDVRGMERLEAFLKLHNGIPTCLYYSVYTLDPEKKTLTKNGKPAVKGKINSQNAVYANEIALDFDEIGEESYYSMRELLAQAGIYPYWIFSGHGYQAHILLEEPIYEKDLLLRFVYQFRAKGFLADPSCIDPARIMRLPFTYNCKFFSNINHIERKEPILCDTIAQTTKRYDVAELEYLMNQLPTVYEEELEEYYKIIKQKKSISSAPATEQDNIEVKEEKIDYPHIKNYNIPDAICKMLVSTPENYRNKSLGFMIKYFMTYCRMSKKQIYEILSIWRAAACKPAMDKSEFEADFSRLYLHSGLNYDSELAKKFGYIPFEENIQLKSKDIYISNEFFEEFDVLDGKVVRMYLAIRMLEHTNKEATQESIAKLLGISDRAVRKTLKDLLSTKHIYVVEGNRKRKIPNTYHASKIYSASKGYISFTYNDIKCYVKELFEEGKRGNGELKLMLFMKYRFKNGDIFMSQTNLGKHIGLEQNTISGIVSKLEEKSFLHVEKRPAIGNQYLESCVYTLLR